MIRTIVLLTVATAGAFAQTTTAVYKIAAASSPVNNAGHTLEQYINANVATCLTETPDKLMSADTTPVAWTATQGTSWKGVYVPLQQNCGAAQKAEDAKKCENIMADPAAPLACAYTDKLTPGCTKLAPACYKAWQVEAGPTTVTTTTGTTTTAATTVAATTVAATTVAATTAPAAGAAAATTKAAAGATTKAPATAGSGSSAAQQPVIIIVPNPGTGGSTGSTSGSSGSSGSSSSGGCSDSHKWCNFWAGKGECAKNPFYMKDSCCKSCQSAGSGSSGSSSSSGTSGSSSGSSSEHELCAFWASKGECEKNAPWMKPNCKKACASSSGGGGGGGGSSGGCSDEESKCGGWASSGECTKNPYYMNWKCKKSCNKC